MGPVLVFGHRNPDNDSVCSAVAYSHLKNLTDPESVHVPVRLGTAPPETVWVFERFGVALPEQVEHVHTRVRDVMTTDVVTIGPDTNMLVAGALMREHDVRALPVVADGVVRGLVNQTILAELYVRGTGLEASAEYPVGVGQLAEALDGEVLAGDADAQLAGRVLIGAMEPETMVGYIEPGDVIVLGDRVRTQPMALEAGAACLVVTGGFSPSDDVLAEARARGAAVISTPHHTHAAARRIELARSAEQVMDRSVMLVEPDALLSDAAEDLLGSVQREAVVVDAGGRIEGILTRTNVARGLRRRVVLVDHNELAQSAPGVEDAQVVEIVDHHRVGDVQTAGPALFINLPVGSTATVIAERYRELGVQPTAAMAGVMLSAVLTDTVLLKSPTTTETDREVAKRLSALADVDALEFGMELFRARSAAEAFSAKQAVRGDLKEYRVRDDRIGIAQVETVDAAALLEAHGDGLARELAALAEDRGYTLALLMVTDVVREGSHLLAAGRARVAERALGVELGGGSAWLPGVLSRKKQVAGPIIETAG